MSPASPPRGRLQPAATLPANASPTTETISGPTAPGKMSTNPKVAAPIAAAAGSVSSQAMTMLPATPQRTADSFFVAPTPMMALKITCVVDTGMPRWAVT